jgi:hypothetical protein
MPDSIRGESGVSVLLCISEHEQGILDVTEGCVLIVWQVSEHMYDGWWWYRTG